MKRYIFVLYLVTLTAVSYMIPPLGVRAPANTMLEEHAVTPATTTPAPAPVAQPTAPVSVDEVTRARIAMLQQQMAASPYSLADAEKIYNSAVFNEGQLRSYSEGIRTAMRQRQAERSVVIRGDIRYKKIEHPFDLNYYNLMNLEARLKMARTSNLDTALNTVRMKMYELQYRDILSEDYKKMRDYTTHLQNLRNHIHMESFGLFETPSIGSPFQMAKPYQQSTLASLIATTPTTSIAQPTTPQFLGDRPATYTHPSTVIGR